MKERKDSVENGIEKFPRKLPSVKTFKCVIDIFKKSSSVKIDYPKKIENTEVYINAVLEGFMWPILRTLPRRERYWFQQDGPHLQPIPRVAASEIQ